MKFIILSRGGLTSLYYRGDLLDYALEGINLITLYMEFTSLYSTGDYLDYTTVV